VTLVKVTLFPLPPPMLPASEAPEQYSQYDGLAVPLKVAFAAYEGDFKNAALDGERALTLPTLGASDAQIHFLLAKLYMKLKQPDLAKAHLEKFQAAP
jgi:hypothetical protein